MPNKTFRFILGASVVFSILPIPSSTLAADSVVVYSARKEHLIKPAFDQFTKETGIAVSYITDGEAPLMAKLKAEGQRSPADVFMTVDAGNLWHAAHEGLLQPVESKVLQDNVPTHLRDPQNQWFGLSVRARTIAYNPKKVKPADLAGYTDLATPQWKGRLCLRTSKKVYNQSLVAMMMADFGAEKTESIVKNWVANLATKVFPDDTAVLKAIDSGACDVGIVNTYYFGALQKENPSLNVALFWPDQKGKGVHVNISGAGVAKYAKNRAGAVKLLEWLSSPTAQKLFADVNLEYPVNPTVEPTAQVKAWGSFKQNPLNVVRAGEMQADAIKLMDRAGYQ